MKTALLQFGYQNSKARTLVKTEELIKEASENGSKLVVLPELHQNNYFCITEDVENFNLADSYEEDVKFWSSVAKKYSIVLVTSLFEKRAAGLYHNTAVVFENDGTIAGKYRKMHIPDDPGFYEKFYFTPGDLGFEPIQTSVGRLGVLICWDQWFPEAARLMALKGAEVLIYPTAIGWFDEDSKDEKNRQLESWITVQRSHAISNGVPLISINRTGYESDATKAIDGIRFWGNSFAVGAQGEYLAQADSENETIIYINIDYKRSEDVRKIWPFLRDRRIEAYDGLNKRYLID